ncbi:CCN family member 3-like [Pollicipes pollicipes]|uniref:CCN family member 3-like n=1 Tax=Pollicipes pollicipes TaxID=41117 RepID=UPI0018851C6D|nr:CCN family member 3-like [Pollicipes pollicipes]
MRLSAALEWSLLLFFLGTTFVDGKTVCQFPCPACPEEVRCQEGVSLILDGCRCCPICSRQHGQRCDTVQLCDVTKQLVCDVAGICRGRNFSSCLVNGTSFHDGQTFLLDCRTQCTCQDGSYACTSLCPHEMIRPSRRCKNPTLAEVKGECCRQWMCADEAPVTAPPCEPLTSDWSPCSATCGGGVSTRISNKNTDCTLVKETRLCQIRECPLPDDTSWSQPLYRMMQQDDRVCHPTQRAPMPVHLRWSNCTSVHRYRPRFCTACRRRCCRPMATSTTPLPFRCDLDRPAGVSDHLWRLGGGATAPATRSAHHEVAVQPVMWVKECVCDPCEKEQIGDNGNGSESNGGEEQDGWFSQREGVKASHLAAGGIHGDEPL